MAFCHQIAHLCDLHLCQLPIKNVFRIDHPLHRFAVLLGRAISGLRAGRDGYDILVRHAY